MEQLTRIEDGKPFERGVRRYQSYSTDDTVNVTDTEHTMCRPNNVSSERCLTCNQAPSFAMVHECFDDRDAGVAVDTTNLEEMRCCLTFL